VTFHKKSNEIKSLFLHKFNVMYVMILGIYSIIAFLIYVLITKGEGWGSYLHKV